MRIHSALFLLLATPLAAQQPRQLTADDYSRAEKFLAASVAPLVTGMGVDPTWLPDGRFWYRTTVLNGYQFYMVDPARKSRQAAFDQDRLASALARASGGSVSGKRLPFQTFELSKDNRSISVDVRGRGWTCDIQTYSCKAKDSIPASRRAPENASTSPDGTTAVYIRQFNLWARDLATGVERQLTTDGIENFGYATDNAGWVHSARPVVTWSSDSKKVATFQQDERGSLDFVLSSTSIGAPRIERWKYPLPGDSVIFRISRRDHRCSRQGE